MEHRATSNHNQRGQALIVLTLMMSVLGGMLAMSIDTGLVFQDRRSLQNAADAAVMAGVVELPQNPSEARDKAREWLAKHDVAPEEITTVEIRQTFIPNDTIYVELDTSVNWIFARVLGMISTDVGASAAAQVGSLGGNSQLMPWALMEGDSGCLTPEGVAIFGGTCSVKVGATASLIPGWYGALDLDGNGGGAAEYKANVIDGMADTRYCIAGDDSPGCVSAVSVIDTLTGNKTGPTGQGIDERITLMGTACDADGNGKEDFGEVFKPSGVAKPAYVVACPKSPRLIIIPIVNYVSTPVHTVVIHGWSLAYLESYACIGDCQGLGHWSVNIKIVDAAYSQATGYLSAYNPATGITMRRIVE